ncbi:hypothetical protein C8J56DRAFT_897069 [Mycena floridula]|nr:hypothetical protein C8J56DRAFT_897069 [Mycena floridula]
MSDYHKTWYQYERHYIEASQIPGFSITIEGLKWEAKLILGVQLGGKILGPKQPLADELSGSHLVIRVSSYLVGNAGSIQPRSRILIIQLPSPVVDKQQMEPAVQRACISGSRDASQAVPLASSDMPVSDFQWNYT